MNAPGSPSSPLQMMYFSSPGLWRANFHLVPGGEAGAAATAHARLGHHRDDSSGVMLVSAVRAAS